MKRYLGTIKKIHPSDLTYCLNKIVLEQSYRSNCWWIGKLTNFENNKLTLDKSVYIQRGDGKIYNTSPSRRTIKCEYNDILYLVI